MFDHSLAQSRFQLEPFGLAGVVTLQSIAEGHQHSNNHRLLPHEKRQCFFVCLWTSM